MPLSAAFSVLIALPIASNRPPRSVARLLSDCAVKKLVGLSRAELTRLPVERRIWVCEMRSPVDCKLSRFERTPLESTLALMAKLHRQNSRHAASVWRREHNDPLGLMKC